LTRPQQLSRERRQRRFERYQQVIALHQRGISKSGMGGRGATEATVDCRKKARWCGLVPVEPTESGTTLTHSVTGPNAAPQRLQPYPAKQMPPRSLGLGTDCNGMRLPSRSSRLCGATHNQFGTCFGLGVAGGTARCGKKMPQNGARLVCEFR
jgi:hypothetical protein